MGPRLSRRVVLGGLLGAAWSPTRAWSAASRPRFVADPFSLGVASGYPTPAGVSLWTRLAPIPLLPDGGMEPVAVPVTLEVATDESFATIVQTAESYAFPELGHSVHVDVKGLEPDRWYVYRFQVGEARSPVGRTRTAPATDAALSRLRFAIGSCQHFEQGWYTAHRHLREEQLDLMLFLGDYIYEESWGDDLVRKYQGGEARTLGDYRVRHAQHRSDPDLQGLHGDVPWLVVWDDHEVDNDWAGDRSEHVDPAFLTRRAAAFQAWYEHMPVPAHWTPHGPSLQIYDSVAFGQLARFVLVDDRQYRSPQACPSPSRGGGSTLVDDTSCPEVLSPDRTLLGAEQERWVDGTFASSRQRWNLLAQQTLMATVDGSPDKPGVQRWTDGWDGYPEARSRLLASMRKRKVSNPVVLGGDVHCTFVADLHLDAADPRSPVIASEFCGTSITSQGRDREASEATQAAHPHMKYVNGWQRGYVAFELTPERCAATVRAVDVKRADSAVETVASFVVQDGTPGPVRDA